MRPRGYAATLTMRRAKWTLFLGAALVVALGWACAEGAPSRTWTEADRAQMLGAELALRQHHYEESIALLMPLYEKAPHHTERFTSPRDLPRDALPPGVEWESCVSGMLWRAMRDGQQYTKALALHGAYTFRTEGAPLQPDGPDVRHYRELMGDRVSQYPCSMAVNDLWVDFSPEPVLREECLFVPLAQLAPHLGFEAETPKGQARIELRRKEPPKHLVFEDGKKDVGSQEAGGLKLEHAPFVHEGTLMVPAAEVAKLLKGEVHWYPEVRFMHLIIPKVPAKRAEQ